MPGDTRGWSEGTIVDELGVLLPDLFEFKGPLQRAFYKRSKGLPLTEKERQALIDNENRKTVQKAQKDARKQTQKAQKERQLAEWRAMGYPTTPKGQANMEALLAIEFEEGITDRKEQAARLNMQVRNLYAFIQNHSIYYESKKEEHLQRQRKALEQKLTIQRIKSMETMIAMIPQADQVVGDILASEDVSPQTKLKAAQEVSKRTGMSREEMREDDKLAMVQEKQKVELDTIRLLASRGRYKPPELPADIQTTAEVVEDE